MKGTLAFVVCMLIACSTAPPVSAQEILVARPPVYQPGENFVGKWHIQSLHAALESRQRTFLAHDGIVYLENDLVTSDGTVIEKTVINPITELGTISTPLKTIETLSTTCPADKVYPVFIGKKLSCSVLLRDNGEQKTLVEELDFTGAQRDVHGNVISICNTIMSALSAIYACSTPDMKWIRFAVFTH